MLVYLTGKLRNTTRRIIAISVTGILILLSVLVIKSIRKNDKEVLPGEPIFPASDTLEEQDQRTDTLIEEHIFINQEQPDLSAPEDPYETQSKPVNETKTNAHEINTVWEEESINVNLPKVHNHKELQVPDSTIKNPEAIPVKESELQTDDRTDSVDCSRVVISAEVEIEESCEQRPTGKISIVKSSIRGGNPPYGVSVDNGKNFYSSFVFGELPPGNYILWLKDKYNCLTNAGSYWISSIDCNYDFVFAPDKGELWKVPNNENTGNLKIYNQQGKLVFNNRIDYSGAYLWDGRSSVGSSLPMGVYQFILELDNKDLLIGNITIVR